MTEPTLPVVDPTTGLVDPDEVIVVTERLRDPDWSLLSPEHRAQIESLQLTVAHLRTERDAMGAARDDWHDRWQAPVGERDEVLDAIEGWHVRVADLRTRLAAYEELETAARAWRERARKPEANGQVSGVTHD